ncbi:MAG TPA: polysaccharide deacetylase family protein [Solirubrobacteraceae bacterium]
MSADDHRIPGPVLTSALAGTALLGYVLPGLAGARARLLSDRALVRALDGAVAGGALWERLGIEGRTASGRGYALTFDDGPHPQGTPAVLEILAGAGVHATFFLVGEQVRRNPTLGREIVAEGHGIGLHCDRHRNLLRLAPWQVRADIARAQASIEDATGRSPSLYRPPYGVLNATALRLARGRGWRTLLWSQWGRDWEARATPESIATRVTDGASEGSVLLLHDADDYSAPGSWRRTAEALPAVLERLGAMGLEPVAP